MVTSAPGVQVRTARPGRVAGDVQLHVVARPTSQVGVGQRPFALAGVGVDHHHAHSAGWMGRDGHLQEVVAQDVGADGNAAEVDDRGGKGTVVGVAGDAAAPKPGSRDVDDLPSPDVPRVGRDRPQDGGGPGSDGAGVKAGSVRRGVVGDSVRRPPESSTMSVMVWVEASNPSCTFIQQLPPLPDIQTPPPCESVPAIATSRSPLSISRKSVMSKLGRTPGG